MAEPNDPKASSDPSSEIPDASSIQTRVGPRPNLTAEPEGSHAPHAPVQPTEGPAEMPAQTPAAEPDGDKTSAGLKPAAVQDEEGGAGPADVSTLRPLVDEATHVIAPGERAPAPPTADKAPQGEPRQRQPAPPAASPDDEVITGTFFGTSDEVQANRSKGRRQRATHRGGLRPLASIAASPGPTGPAHQENTAVTAAYPPAAQRGDGSASPDDLPILEIQRPEAKLTLAADLLPPVQTPTRLRWPYIVLAVVVLSIGTGGLLLRKNLARMRAGRMSVPAVTPAPVAAHEEAQMAYVQGVRAFGNKDYTKAIAAFEAALRKEETFAEAHRSLGIVYATQKNLKAAVIYYKRYLALQPAATDAAQVQKIVDDYQLSEARTANRGRKQRHSNKKAAPPQKRRLP